MLNRKFKQIQINQTSYRTIRKLVPSVLSKQTPQKTGSNNKHCKDCSLESHFINIRMYTRILYVIDTNSY